MNKLAMMAWLVASSGCGCDLLVDCQGELSVDVIDGAAEPVAQFSVVATIEGSTVEADCEGDGSGSASTEVKGQSIWLICKEPGGFTLNRVAQPRRDVDLEVVADAGSFAGTLDPTLETLTDSCGGECTRGTATVVLDP